MKEVFFVVLAVVLALMLGMMMNIWNTYVPEEEGIWKLGDALRKKENRKGYLFPILNLGIYGFLLYMEGCQLETVLMCVVTSLLLALSIIDLRCFEIPLTINYAIGGCGILMTLMDIDHIWSHVIGFVIVSGFLDLVGLFSEKVLKKEGMGGGDIKLMAVAGLFLGGKLVVLAFFLGCVLGSVIHIIRMAVTKEKSMLAFGPYLSLGIFISMIWGDSLIQWYLNYIMGGLS